MSTVVGSCFKWTNFRKLRRIKELRLRKLRKRKVKEALLLQVKKITRTVTIHWFIVFLFIYQLIHSILKIFHKLLKKISYFFSWLFDIIDQEVYSFPVVYIFLKNNSPPDENYSPEVWYALFWDFIRWIGKINKFLGENYEKNGNLAFWCPIFYCCLPNL